MTEQRPEYVTDALVLSGAEKQSGFQSPNYTQVPNDFFEMIGAMSEAELRVTLIMMRETFGYHRDAAKVGMQELANRTGLSYNGASAGCEAAGMRGTLRRTNPDAKTKAEWEIVVDRTPSASEGVSRKHPQPVRVTPSASEGQVGLNKDKEKRGKETPAPDFVNMTPQEVMKLKELRVFRDTTGRIPGQGQWETVYETIRGMNGNGTPEALKPYWKAWNARGYNVSSLVWLTEWAVAGEIPPQSRKGAPESATPKYFAPYETKTERDYSKGTPPPERVK